MAVMGLINVIVAHHTSVRNRSMDGIGSEGRSRNTSMSRSENSTL